MSSVELSEADRNLASAFATTTAVRLCCGFAGIHPCVSDGQGSRVIAVEEWPWSGEEIVSTHGLCERCAAEWHAAMDARELPASPLGIRSAA